MIKSPMLACSTQPNLEDLNYPIYASYKLDGIRCVTPTNQVLSRKLKPIPNKYIQQKLKGMPVGFDGELMIEGNFNEASSAIMSAEGNPKFMYFVFDLCDRPANEQFQTRYSELKQVVKELGKWSPEVILVTQKLCHSPKEVREYYDIAIAAGHEGLILRSLDGLYKEGRSTLKQQWLLKLKPVLDTEATIVGFKELMRNGNDPIINAVGGQERNKQMCGMYGGNTLGALICHDSQGNQIDVGSGFTAEQRQEIWNNQAKYLTKMVTFKFQERTPDGSYRFPVFKAFRKDL